MDGIYLCSKWRWVEVTGRSSAVQDKEQSVFPAFFLFFKKALETYWLWELPQICGFQNLWEQSRRL